MRRTIGSRELKTRLGTYLREVQEGATILVTERGRPVAELRPVSLSSSEEEARLDELAALGVITRGTGVLPPVEPIRIPGLRLSDAITEEREESL